MAGRCESQPRQVAGRIVAASGQARAAPNTMVGHCRHRRTERVDITILSLTPQLMERMGHSTTRAALIYLHATDERQRVVADAVDAAARTALGKDKKGRSRATSGTDLARKGKKAL